MSIHFFTRTWDGHKAWQFYSNYSLKYFIFSEDEISLLVIVVDVNPIWWGQQAQREPEVEL